MKNKKIGIVLVLCICIIWSLYAVTIPIQSGFDITVFDGSTDINDGQDEYANDINYTIQDFNRISQCFWGTWMMTEELHGQDGWKECRDEFQGLTVKFSPGKFSYQNESREIPYYYCEIIAIENADGYFREAGEFQELGLEGQYYLKFYPHWDDLNDAIGLLWDYILVSETELIIPDARSRMYRMEKVEEYPVMEDEADCLEIIPYQSICYGLWEVTEEIGESYAPISTGYKIGIFGNPCSFDYCQVLDRYEESVDEMAELIGLGDGNDRDRNCPPVIRTDADGIPVAWMDCKAYCLDGNLYSLVFLFRAQEQTVLGNFHCSFPHYDVRKPAVLKLLATVRV